MASWTKIVGGFFGFLFGGMFGGYIGSIIGALAGGKLLDSLFGDPENPKDHRRSDFVASLVVLAAAVMKADDKILKSELNFFKQFFVANFGEEKTRQVLPLLKQLLERDINVEKAARDIRYSMNYQSRLILLDFLFRLALADNDPDPRELKVITRIAIHMGIRQADFTSMQSMYFQTYRSQSGYQQQRPYSTMETTSAYEILGVSPNATNEEIKKAYRQLSIKHHPDKVGHLGEEVRKAAEEKFSKINQAYDIIKKERNIK